MIEVEGMSNSMNAFAVSRIFMAPFRLYVAKLKRVHGLCGVDSCCLDGGVEDILQ